METNWRFHHVGVVVRDMDKAIEYYQSLGIFTFQPETMLDSSTFADYKVCGKIPGTVQKVRIRFAEVGPYGFELLSPIEGETIYKEFLNSKGEGIHPLGFRVDDLDGEVAKLREKGISILMSGRRPGGTGFTYFDTRKVGNAIIALSQAPR